MCVGGLGCVWEGVCVWEGWGDMCGRDGMCVGGMGCVWEGWDVCVGGLGGCALRETGSNSPGKTPPTGDN